MENGVEDNILEGTLALIKPDALGRAKEIIDIILSEGFLIVEKRQLRMSKEMATEFYEEHRTKSFFPDLIHYMTSGDIVALCIARKDGIQFWNYLLGPNKPSEARQLQYNTIRGLFGSKDNDMLNACHGSDSPESSEREIGLLFPHILYAEDSVPDVRKVPDPETESDEFMSNRKYLEKYVVPTLMKGLGEMYVTRPRSPIEWLADWLAENNPNKM